MNTTQPETGVVDNVVKDVSVPREVEIERDECCQDKDKGTTKQTSTLGSSFSSHHIEEVAWWSRKEEKNLTQSCEQCNVLKTVGNQEKKYLRKEVLQGQHMHTLQQQHSRQRGIMDTITIGGGTVVTMVTAETQAI